MIYERLGKLSVNLKCDPFEADFLRQAFEDVTPGWHMNKTHWNTVTLGGDVPEDELKRMIEQSYDLIKPKARDLKPSIPLIGEEGILLRDEIEFEIGV